MRIIHLINLFKPKNELQEKTINFVLRSINKSIKYHSYHHKDLEIIPIALFYKEDEDMVPSYFRKASVLEEDAYTKLEIETPIFKKVPFLKDIFNKGLSLVDDYDYMVYTNADIILTNDFYSKAVKKLEEQNLDCISITRRTIPDNLIIKCKLNNIIKNRVRNKTEKHPGHDTFVFRKGVVEGSDYGNVFIGFPPVGSFILFQAELNGFRIKIQKDEYLTYHLGDDRSWLGKELLPYMFKNKWESSRCFFDFDVYDMELKKKRNVIKKKELIN